MITLGMLVQAGGAYHLYLVRHDISEMTTQLDTHSLSWLHTFAMETRNGLVGIVDSTPDCDQASPKLSAEELRRRTLSIARLGSCLSCPLPPGPWLVMLQRR